MSLWLEGAVVVAERNGACVMPATQTLRLAAAAVAGSPFPFELSHGVRLPVGALAGGGFAAYPRRVAQELFAAGFRPSGRSMVDRRELNPASGVAVASAFARALSLPAAGHEVAQFVALRAAACVGAEYSNLALLEAQGNSLRLFHSPVPRPGADCVPGGLHAGAQ